MTILSVDRSWSRRGSSYGSQDGIDWAATFTDGYQIVHTYDTLETDILLATGVPRVGDLFPGTFAICKKVSLSKVGQLMSIAVCEYDGQSGPTGVADNPLNQRPKYVWSDVVTNEPINQDVNGKPIVTVNGEAIEGVTMEIADQVLSVTRNFALFSPWITHQYRHSVSSDSFAFYPAGTARLISFSAESQEGPRFTYWSVNAKIQFRFPYNTTPDKAWHARVLHEGFNAKLGTKKNIPAPNGVGQPTMTKVLLKADGTLEDNPNNAIWLYFPRYKPLPYAALGLL